MKAGRNPCLWLDRVCVSLVPLGVLATPGVGKDVLASTVILRVSELKCSWVCPISWESHFLCDPVILGVSEHLEFRLPLGVVRVGVETAPRTASGSGSN